MMDFDPELLEEFIQEAQEHMDQMEQDLLELEQHKENVDQEIINRIFRAAHSLKGSAGFLGLTNINKLSHAMENILVKLRDGIIKPDSELIDVILKGYDKLKQLIDDIENSNSISIDEEVELLENFLKKITSGGDTGSGASQSQEAQSTTQETTQTQSTSDIDDYKLSKEKANYIKNNPKPLYYIKITKDDLKEWNGDIKALVNEMKSLGEIIEANFDYENFSNIDSLNKFFIYFATVLEPTLAIVALKLPEEKVQYIDIKDIDKYVGENKPQPTPQASAPKSEEQAQASQQSQQQTTPQKTASTSTQASTQQTQPSKKTEHKKIKVEETLRVSVKLLDELMTLASEMVLARNQLLNLSQYVENEVEGFANTLQAINRLTTELQEKIMQTRMQKVDVVFKKFPRVIRDLANKLNKKVRLEVSGQDVELDKSIIENLPDPMTHLIRNAIDHGIEPPEERKQIGKPEEGVIKIEARQEGGWVIIDISDDGRGLNKEKIIKKAIEKGIIALGEEKNMTDKEIYNLIFQPGFSTAEKVSDISGRGVGMDVVYTNITKLGGTVLVNSEEGKGTTITLRLPLTLAIMPAIVVKAGNHRVAIPQTALVEIVVFSKNDSTKRIEEVHGAPVLRLRGNLLPLLRLTDVLEIERYFVHPETGELMKDRRTRIADRRQPKGLKDFNNDPDRYDGLGRRDPTKNVNRILVLKSNENVFGLLVDEIITNEEIVIKSLPGFLKHLEVYSGISIMGDGYISLIINIEGIIKKANLKFASIEKVNKELQEEEELKKLRESQSLLLLRHDDNENLFAVNIDIIKRIEKVTKDDFEEVGNKLYLKRKDGIIEIVTFDKFFDVEPFDWNKEELFVVIPNIHDGGIAFLVQDIADTLTIHVDLDTKTINNPLLLGTMVIKDKIVLFPDIYKIYENVNPQKYKVEKKPQIIKKDKIKILLVEDTPFFLNTVKRYLVDAGYDVDTAVDGLQGLDLFKKNQGKYDIIVSDIVMPRMNGWDMAAEIRKIDKDIPMIALTTLSSDTDVQKCFEVGFDEYELKLSKERLLKKVANLLEVRGKKLEKKEEN